MPSLPSEGRLFDLLGMALGVAIGMVAVYSGRRWHRHPKRGRGGIPTGIGVLLLLAVTVAFGAGLWLLLA